MANVYRADPVGGLIKPQSLLMAQAALDPAARRAAEDAGVEASLAEQKALVMTVVTDGEFRRADPDEPYAAGFSGIARAPVRGRSALLRSNFAVTGKLQTAGRLFQREVDFLKARNQTRFKLCLASPSALAARLFAPGLTNAAYPNVIELAHAFGELLRAEIDALFAGGVPYVQLNAPHFHALFEGVGANLLSLSGNEAPLFDELLAADQALVNSVSKPADSTLAMRFDRALELADRSDRYERMIERIFEHLTLDRYLLEFDEPEAHDFRALASLPTAAMAVLGLVRTDAEPEDTGAVLDRVDRAVEKSSPEQLALSPRRSFFNVAGQSADAQQKLQHRALLRASEAVQQFWGLEL